MESQQEHGPVIVIGHEWVVSRDAVGNDIAGMYRVLSELGLRVVVLAQSFDDTTAAQLKICQPPAPQLLDADLLIYHHSNYWKAGEEFLRRFRGGIVFRYHNVTPSDFFKPFSSTIAQLCAAAVDQTARFIQRFKATLWLAVSDFNRDDLIARGADPRRISVVPPFNLIDDFLSLKPSPPSFPVKILFVGRFAPNKKHDDLIRIIHSYVTRINNKIILNLVGSTDFANLRDYLTELRRLIDELGLQNNVRIVPTLAHDRLLELFTDSSAFLCCSRHEGFCLPIIEAQAARLPVITINSGALAATVGTGQIVCDTPASPEDYYFFALIIHELASNTVLRDTVIRNGYRNVIRRFSREVIETQFLNELLPTLQQFR